VAGIERPAATDPGDIRLQPLDLAGGFLRTQAMATVASLGVADIVHSAPLPIEQIAARVGANASALHRVMRLLAMDDVFSEVRPGAFAATELSQRLRDDTPHSPRYLAMLHGGPCYQAAGRMVECVRTGEPAAEASLANRSSST
jgi:hypothetical protein